MLLFRLTHYLYCEADKLIDAKQNARKCIIRSVFGYMTTQPLGIPRQNE